jgi:hypothetical protein
MQEFITHQSEEESQILPAVASVLTNVSCFAVCRELPSVPLDG